MYCFALSAYNVVIIRMKINHNKTNTFELSVARGSPHCARAESQIDNINLQVLIYEINIPKYITP